MACSGSHLLRSIRAVPSAPMIVRTYDLAGAVANPMRIAETSATAAPHWNAACTPKLSANMPAIVGEKLPKSVPMPKTSETAVACVAAPTRSMAAARNRDVMGNMNAPIPGDARDEGRPSGTTLSVKMPAPRSSKTRNEDRPTAETVG